MIYSLGRESVCAYTLGILYSTLILPPFRSLQLPLSHSLFPFPLSTFHATTWRSPQNWTSPPSVLLLLFFFTLSHSPSSHKGRCRHMGPDHVLWNLCLTRFQKTIIFAGSLIKWSADEQVHLVWFQIARQHAHWISELAKVRSS